MYLYVPEWAGRAWRALAVMYKLSPSGKISGRNRAARWKKVEVGRIRAARSLLMAAELYKGSVVKSQREQTSTD